MNRFITVCFTIAAFVAPASVLACANPEKAMVALMGAQPAMPIPEPIENEVAACLRAGTTAYLKELNGISFLSFKNKPVPPDIAVALTEEARDVAKAMQTILKILDLLKDTPYENRLPGWVHLAREISTSMSYIYDLEDRGLVQSQWGIALRLFLPNLFDNFILPRLIHPLPPPGFVLEPPAAAKKSPPMEAK